MATTTLAATTVDFVPNSNIRSPPPALQKAPTPLELDDLTWGTRYNGPGVPATAILSESQTSPTPSGIESQPPVPMLDHRHSVGRVQSLQSPKGNLYRFLNTCVISLVMGLNDSAPGALLPYIEKYYDINYSTVSLLFIANALGFVGAAPFTHFLQTKLGRAGILSLAEILVTLAYVMTVSRPPFAVVVVSFCFSGLGAAWALAVNNVFVASMTNGTTLLGIYHGCYGIGGVLGPLMATALVSSGRHWSDFYYITLALAALNGISAYWTSRNYEKEVIASGHEPQLTTLDRGSPGNSAPPSRIRALLRALNSRTTLLGALFIFAYQGAEVAISGWILSFLLTTRPHPASQSSSLGYITSGFFGGITLGRFVLSHFAQRMGERLAVIVLICGCILLQFAVWFVPAIMTEAVAISLVGLLLGPVYAFSISTFSKLLNRGELVSALAFVSAMGSSGGAVAPFVTGVMSQRLGTWVVNPVAVGLFGIMVVFWLCLPKVEKRRE